MAHEQVPHRHTHEPSGWWVVTAWASLALVLAGGLAGAAGLG
jgi:hypothetical protein